MSQVKQMNITSRTYYFSNDMINIKDFDCSLLKADKKSNKNIGYFTIKKIDDYENNSVNILYLITGGVHGFIEEKNGSNYLVLDSADENKEVLKIH